MSKSKCPICSKPTDIQYKPFCCKRCADVDLGKWLGGSYAIPAQETDEPDDADLESMPNE